VLFEYYGTVQRAERACPHGLQAGMILGSGRFPRRLPLGTYLGASWSARHGGAAWPEIANGRDCAAAVASVEVTLTTLPDADRPRRVKMAVERMQCPACGALLAPRAGEEMTVCAYCGARLRITQGASGRPFAVLDGIKADSSILAMEAVRVRLQEKLAALEAERTGVLRGAEASIESNVPGCAIVTAWLSIAGGIIALAASSAFEDEPDALLSFLLGGAFFVIVGVCILKSARSRQNRVDDETEARLAPIADEIRRVQAELAKVESQLDGLAKELMDE